MILEVDNIDIKSILLSGASFRQIEESDGSFTIILKDRIVNIKQDINKLIINSSNNDNIINIIKEYFDLNRDYNKINDYLIKQDKSIIEVINKCKSYRILNQDPFEMGISYIISQNNNVKRITNIVNKISENYGTKVLFNNKEYYLFPSYEQLKNVTKEEFKSLGLGFRDQYVVNYLKEYENLKDLDKLSTKEALDKLMNIKGIGLKVASCILLFGYKRLDVYPIDTWVKQYISENYNIKNDMKSIQTYMFSKYSPYTGLIIQYMFHSKRNS